MTSELVLSLRYSEPEISECPILQSCDDALTPEMVPACCELGTAMPHTAETGRQPPRPTGYLSLAHILGWGRCNPTINHNQELTRVVTSLRLSTMHTHDASFPWGQTDVNALPWKGRSAPQIELSNVDERGRLRRILVANWWRTDVGPRMRTRLSIASFQALLVHPKINRRSVYKTGRYLSS